MLTPVLSPFFLLQTAETPTAASVGLVDGIRAQAVRHLVAAFLAQFRTKLRTRKVIVLAGYAYGGGHIKKTIMGDLSTKSGKAS